MSAHQMFCYVNVMVTIAKAGSSTHGLYMPRCQQVDLPSPYPRQPRHTLVITLCGTYMCAAPSRIDTDSMLQRTNSIMQCSHPSARGVQARAPANLAPLVCFPCSARVIHLHQTLARACHQQSTGHAPDKAASLQHQRHVANAHAPLTTSGTQELQLWQPSSLAVAAGLALPLILALATDPAVAAESSQADPGFSISGLFQAVEDYAASNGAAGTAVFILAYVVSTVLFVPGSVLTLAAGAIYGPLTGTAVVSVASTCGALAAFLVARTAARPWVEDKLKSSPTAQAVVSGVSQQGAKLVLLLRLSPLVPFTLLNYALGLTEVGAVEYTAASWLGMLPGTFAYVYLGGAGRAALDAAGATGGPEPAKLLVWGVGAVATLWASKLISDAAGKALEEAKQQADGSQPAPGDTNSK